MSTDPNDRARAALNMAGSDFDVWRIADLFQERDDSPGTAKARLTVFLHEQLDDIRKKAMGQQQEVTPREWVALIASRPQYLIEAFLQCEEAWSDPAVREKVLGTDPG